MSEWIEEKPTMHLRWEVRIDCDGRCETLQQKWEITRGGTGKVEYSDEWRDVPRQETDK
jgi:hypothetical protein